MEIASERRESELAYLVGSLGTDGYAVVDNGSRSIELVARDNVDAIPRLQPGIPGCVRTFFARAERTGRVLAFRKRLAQEASKASFMKGQRRLVGVEFMEMAELFFPSKERGPRTFSRDQLQQKLREVTTLDAEGFKALRARPDIDRALPRLVVAVYLLEEFGYAQLELTDRELGTGLIIESGMKR